MGCAHPGALLWQVFAPEILFYCIKIPRKVPITTKKDASVTFWAKQFFFCHTYDTSMTIIVTKLGIIIDVVGSYFYDKKS